MNCVLVGVIVGSSVMTIAQTALAADGNVARGQGVFGACVARHSLQPDKNKTGLSLSGLCGCKAGSPDSFQRHSMPMKSLGLALNEGTLVQWLTGPQHVVPGNQSKRSLRLSWSKEYFEPVIVPVPGKMTN